MQSCFAIILFVHIVYAMARQIGCSYPYCSALLSLGRCIDLVKPAGLLVSSVPAAMWSKALFHLEESMSRIKTVCDPDQPLDAAQWGRLFDDEILDFGRNPSDV